MATTFTANTDSSSRVNEYPPSSFRKVITGVLVTDGTDGASAGDIPASLFGLSVIEDSRPLVKNDNTLIVTTQPAYNGASLLAKAAASAAPADIPSGTYKAIVYGY